MNLDGTMNVSVSADCVTFCEEHVILGDLRKCLAEAKERFANVLAIKAELDQFPSGEYEEEGHVAIRVSVASEEDQAFRDYDGYMDWMLDAISPGAIGFFVVTFSRGLRP